MTDCHFSFHLTALFLTKAENQLLFWLGFFAYCYTPLESRQHKLVKRNGN